MNKQLLQPQMTMGMEQLNSPSVDELFVDIVKIEPKLIDDFVPDNGSEQKQKFLNGDIHNPDNHYPKLESNDYEGNAEKIAQLGERIINHSILNQKYKSTYSVFIKQYIKLNRMLELARDIKAISTKVNEELTSEYIMLNHELYGEPEESVYRSLLSEKVGRIAKKDLAGRALDVKNELMDLLGDVDTETQDERFRPSTETIEWMHGVVDSLYGSMLSHVPEDVESFNAEAAQAVFESILHDEFGEAAEDWRIDIEQAQSVNVKASEKRIVIPLERSISQAAMRGLVVHEMGVHMLRAIQGASTDLKPLELGLPGYMNNEEGLGVIMQQALKGEYHESGINHYITIGLANFEKKDFRDTFEIKWRLSALSSLKAGSKLTDEAITKSQNASYGATMRIYRGTDSLPLFKDISYYNGARDMWQYLESIQGDELKFMFVLMGRANPANSDDQRLLLETATIDNDGDKNE